MLRNTLRMINQQDQWFNQLRREESARRTLRYSLYQALEQVERLLESDMMEVPIEMQARLRQIIEAVDPRLASCSGAREQSRVSLRPGVVWRYARRKGPQGRRPGRAPTARRYVAVDGRPGRTPSPDPGVSLVGWHPPGDRHGRRQPHGQKPANEPRRAGGRWIAIGRHHDRCRGRRKFCGRRLARPGKRLCRRRRLGPAPGRSWLVLLPPATDSDPGLPRIRRTRRP